MSNTIDDLMRDVCKQALDNVIAELERFNFNNISVRPLAA